jgi:hypothetical protein
MRMPTSRQSYDCNQQKGDAMTNETILDELEIEEVEEVIAPGFLLSD